MVSEEKVNDSDDLSEQDPASLSEPSVAPFDEGHVWLFVGVNERVDEQKAQTYRYTKDLQLDIQATSQS